MKQRWSKKVNQVLLVLIPALIIFCVAIVSHKSHNKLDQFVPLKPDEQLCLRISKIKQTNYAYSFIYGSNKNCRKLPWADNMTYNPKHLSRFLQPGDSIFKAANSDTLKIYRDGENYHFVFEKRIWK